MQVIENKENFEHKIFSALRENLISEELGIKYWKEYKTNSGQWPHYNKTLN